jgi:hypothetical protein
LLDFNFAFLIEYFKNKWLLKNVNNFKINNFLTY